MGQISPFRYLVNHALDDFHPLVLALLEQIDNAQTLFYSWQRCRRFNFCHDRRRHTRALQESLHPIPEPEDISHGDSKAANQSFRKSIRHKVLWTAVFATAGA